MVKEKSKEVDIKDILEPVKELPKPLRMKRNTVYDQIIEEAMKSNEKFFKVNLPMKKIYGSLDLRIKRDKLPLKIRVRNKVLYLEKTS
jgi:hypothetical protein